MLSLFILRCTDLPVYTTLPCEHIFYLRFGSWWRRQRGAFSAAQALTFRRFPQPGGIQYYRLILFSPSATFYLLVLGCARFAAITQLHHHTREPRGYLLLLTLTNSGLVQQL